MNIDKSSWQRVKFGDVVRLNTDRCADPISADVERYVGLEHIEPDDLHIRRWGSVEEGTTFTNYFRPGHVLFGKRRAYQRKVAVADFEGVCSGDIYVLEPKDKRLLPELLPFLCQTQAFSEHAVGTSAGSLSPRTNWELLSDFEFELPPHEIQVQIATLLWRLVDAEAHLIEATNKASAVRASLLEELLHSNRSNCTEFGYFRVPATWQRRRLPDLVVHEPNALTAGPFGTIFKAKDFRESGVPIIQIRHVTENGFRSDKKLTYMDTQVYLRLHQAFTVHTGDLLITKMGEPPGIACLYPDGMPNAMVTPDVIKATLDSSVVVPDFMVQVLNSRRAQASILRLCKGGTRTRVSLNEFYELEWPIPGIEEQRRILAILSPLTELKSKAHCRIDVLHSIRRNIFEMNPS